MEQTAGGGKPRGREALEAKACLASETEGLEPEARSRDV